MIRTLAIIALMVTVFVLIGRLIRLGFSGHTSREEPGQDEKSSEPEDPFCEKDLLALSADRQSLEERVENLGRFNSRMLELFECGSAIGSLEEMVSMLSSTVELIRDYLQLDDLKLLLFDEAGLPIEIAPGASLGSNFLKKAEETGPPISRFSDVLERGYEIGNSTYSMDISIASELELGSMSEVALSTDDGTATLAVSFVGTREHLIGILVAADSKQLFAPGQQAGILESLGSHTLGTIRNVRVYHELRQRVDDLNTAKNKLEEASAVKSSIVSAASHELKTPLASIRAYARTLERSIGSEDVEVQKQFLKVIDEESERLMRIVEEILSLSKLEKGRMKIQFDEIDIGETIDETCEILRPSAIEKGIELVCRYQQDSISIEADPDLVRQLLMNLVSNAIKFTGQDGTVTISLWEERSCIKLTVEDDGIGIPRGELDKIFDEFYQVTRDSRYRSSGSGLGLAICHDIVRWHEGRIWVDSTEHVGTTFTVALPKRHSYGGRTGRVLRREMRDPEAELMVSLMVEMIGEVMSSDKVCLLVMHPDSDVLSIEAGLGLDLDQAQELKVAPGDGLAGDCYQGRRAAIISDTQHPDFQSLVEVFGPSVSGGLAVPILSGDECRGVILAARSSGGRPGIVELGLAEALSERVSGILGWLARYREQKSMLTKARDAMRSVVDTRRYYSGGKSGRLAATATDVGRKMGVPEELLPTLSYAATIYDVGMVRVRDDILRKADVLSESEVDSIRSHSERGLEILEPVESSREVRDAILYHHERYDGRGYPSGLAGERIPLFARIIAVIDAFESMVQDRPHRTALSRDMAIQEMRKNSGSQFDPDVVGALLEAIGEEST